MSGSWNPINIVTNVVKSAADIVADSTNYLADRARDIKNDVQDAANNIARQVQNIVNKVEEESLRVGSQVTNEVKRQLVDLRDNVKSLGKTIDDVLINNVVDQIKNDLDALANFTRSIIVNYNTALNGALRGDLS